MRPLVAEFGREVDLQHREIVSVHSHNHLGALIGKDRGQEQETKQPVKQLADHTEKASRLAPRLVQFPVYLINMMQNAEFMGRENELDILSKLLLGEHNEPSVASYSLQGEPGVGKTEVALEFASQYKDSFDAVFWVNLNPENPAEAVAAFGNIGRHLHWVNGEEMDESHIDVVVDWLEQTAHNSKPDYLSWLERRTNIFLR
ncbi:hypothetical protein B0T14DRAFT_522700 [Immersiella caudata]|uniref:NB-ARC domain-containing protein n=1 Tax=Immersiella caudata TaxID=314043 RepID=A0AA39WIU5_9PEZI|nr:hypothetical protein B0T14DRAFT_522700 [Immersiella caudata]